MSSKQFHIVHPDMPLPPSLAGGAVAIGNFDGVHRGHQAVLGRAAEIACARAIPSLALTFEPHPRTFFRPGERLFRLTPAPVKARLIGLLGLDGVVELAFDAALASLPAEAFVDDILLRRLGVRAVVVGHDFHFGKARRGTPGSLAQMGRKLGFDVDIVAPVGSGAEVFASRRVRGLLAAGEVAEAARILGYRWFVRGEVTGGARRGRDLGFPTANMRLAPETTLRHGVYTVRARLDDGRTLGGVASYGSRPQFDGGAPLLETHLFDFSGDLYGRVLEVEFAGFLRPEARFAGVAELVAQMERDAAAARTALRGLAHADPLAGFPLAAALAG